MSLMLLLKSDYKNLLRYNQQLHEENFRIKELNSEMYDTLKGIHFYLQQIGSVDSLLRNSLYREQETAVIKILVKAEGMVGE